MTRNHLILLLLPLLAACGHTSEEVIATYADGAKMLVNQYKVRGESRTRIGETRYYADGTLQYEKHFTGKDQQPTGTWRYYYSDGKPFATGTFDKQHKEGTDWHFYNHEGKDLFSEDYDSLRVAELSEMLTPATIIVSRGDSKTYYQFYSNCTLRSLGQLKDGQRDGHWVFYHPSGQIQTEADFVDGKQHGNYTVYRENGLPYYRGTYSHGQRVGTWEFYDAQGNLTHTQSL
ncbi:MAG: hypothetical protein IJ620_05020 [Bacteroidales bacterium]|nr:hypothetical protein [Bacteroidales bacterium]